MEVQPFEAAPMVGPKRNAGTGSQVLRVASVPAGHVYVQHLASPGGRWPVLRLTDPRPCGAPSRSQRWWPPVMLDPAWVGEHADDFDVFHLHFGFDAQTPQRLAELVDELRRRGKPLVYTVHDLENPHHRDPALHRSQLDVLVPAAARLITLTPGAAAAISDRWHRTAVVLPHPHVVEPPLLVRARPRREGFTVGVHAKSMRANMAVLPVVEVLAEVVAGLDGARLRVDVHPDVDDPAAHAFTPEVLPRLRALAEEGRVDLRVHDYFDDDALWDYLQDLDLSVLPYRFGTHSGWLEACYDLGTPVCAPSCGFYAQQRPCLEYRHDRDGLDVSSLRRAVHTAYRRRPSWRADPRGRAAEREALARAHDRIYRAVLP